MVKRQTCIPHTCVKHEMHNRTSYVCACPASTVPTLAVYRLPEDLSAGRWPWFEVPDILASAMWLMRAWLTFLGGLVGAGRLPMRIFGSGDRAVGKRSR